MHYYELHETNNLLKDVLLTAYNFIDAVGAYEGAAADTKDYLYRNSFAGYESDAKTALEPLGVWDCLALVKNYETYAFGRDAYWKAEPFAIANDVYYIVGDYLLSKSERWVNLDEDSYLTDDDINLIQGELRDYIESLTGWRELWGEVLNAYNVF